MSKSPAGTRPTALLLAIGVLGALQPAATVAETADDAQSIETGTVTDREGHEYPTVKIGDQWWMAANLNAGVDDQGNPVTGFCYDHDESSCEVYGRLYTWSAAMNGSSEEGAQGICPEGWHLPSDDEWRVLFDVLGGIDVAGGAMKATGTSLWLAPNEGATNTSGFNGLPTGGYLPQLDLFEGQGVGAHFWSSTEHGSRAGIPTLHKDEIGVTHLVESKEVTASVRCVMDPRRPQ
jgi:uncharacterized protein (TIGR02145 family)